MNIQSHAVAAQAGGGSVGVGSGDRRPKSDDSATTASDFDRRAFAVAIGDRNTDGYLAKFERFHRGSRKLTWNWPAFFVTFMWLLYRKQWLYAIGYFFASVVVQIAAVAAVELVPSLDGAAHVAMLLVLFVPPALFANTLYYRHCRKLVAQAQSGAGSRDEQIGVLKGKGGTSQAALIIVVVLAFVAIVGLLAGIALPAYQDYTARAKASDALVVARQATASVEIYYKTHQRFPAALADAGFAGGIPAHVTGLNVNPENGAVTVEVVLSASDRAVRHMLFTPSVQGDQSITWTCHSPDLKPSVLPLACRRRAP